MSFLPTTPPHLTENAMTVLPNLAASRRGKLDLINLFVTIDSVILSIGNAQNAVDAYILILILTLLFLNLLYRGLIIICDLNNLQIAAAFAAGGWEHHMFLIILGMVLIDNTLRLGNTTTT